MIQNVARGYQEDNDKISEKINFSEMFLRLFSVRNIIVYILTFMISMVSIGQGNGDIIAPFGLALVAASISNGVPIAIVYLSSLLGTSLSFGISEGLSFLGISAVLLVLVLIKKPIRDEEKTEQVHLGGYLFFSIILVKFINMLIHGFYFYDGLVAVSFAVNAFIFYKIFVNSLSVISEFGIKKAFSVEEVVGAGLIISLAASAFGNLSVFSFSIRNIVCIFIVLALGWKNGVILGGIGGITVGMVLGIIAGGSPILIATYSIAGMIAGLLNRFGKIGVIVGFILGNIIVAYSANGGMENIIMFQEILIAAVGLLVLPKNIKININDLVPSTKLLPESTGQIEESAETVLKLNSISKTVEEMSNGYEENNSAEKNFALFEAKVYEDLDKLEGNLLYEDIQNSDILEDVFKSIVENNILTENEMVSIFAKRNIFLMNSDDKNSNSEQKIEVRRMIKYLNKVYGDCKKDFVWIKKIDENNKIASEQLKNVKEAIDGIAEKIKEEKKEEYAAEKKQIKEILELDGIVLKDISIKKEDSGRIIINSFTDICENEDGKNCPIKKIERAINKTFNEKFIMFDQKCGLRLNKTRCAFKYISEDKYIMQTGIAKTKKNESIVSGDTMIQTRLGDGKYLVAISDGMGSGAEARKNSKLAIGMIERLIGSGFNKDTSLKLINSAIINANQQEDMYATLDVEIVDLYAGRIEMIKNGACPTFIKRNRQVSIISSSTLPAGIMSEIKTESFEKELMDGDILIICSDGILESSIEYADKNKWLEQLINDIETDNPERIADIILKEAIDNNIGKARDDMSVIVSKIIKK